MSSYSESSSNTARHHGSRSDSPKLQRQISSSVSQCKDQRQPMSCWWISWIFKQKIIRQFLANPTVCSSSLSLLVIHLLWLCLLLLTSRRCCTFNKFFAFHVFQKITSTQLVKRPTFATRGATSWVRTTHSRTTTVPTIKPTLTRRARTFVCSTSPWRHVPRRAATIGWFCLTTRTRSTRTTTAAQWRTRRSHWRSASATFTFPSG